MGAFTVRRAVAADAQRTWAVLVDWPRHSGTVPFTRVRAVPAADGSVTGVGSGLVARTGIGPLAYDDLMQVTDWVPPTDAAAGHCRLEKQGRGVTGGAHLTVAPAGPDRCAVVWHEQADVLGVRRLPLGAVESLVGRLVFGRALRLLARQAEAA